MNILEPFNKLPNKLRFVLAYLLVTPVFWLTDILLGWEIRIAFLQHEGWKSVYYSVLLASGITCYLRPGWTAVFAFVESTANVFIHIISFVVPIFTLPAQVLSGETPDFDLSTSHILSFILVGSIMIISFQAAVDELRHQ